MPPLVRSPERAGSPRSIAELRTDIIAARPRQVDAFVADNAHEQKEGVLTGRLSRPNHHYPYLESFDFESAHNQIDRLEDEVAAHPEINPKHKPTYQEMFEQDRGVFRVMELAHRLKQDLTSAERAEAEEAYMEVNRQVYGEPDQNTYLCLVKELRARLEAKDLHSSLVPEYERLQQILPEPPSDLPERFRPSQEAKDFVKTAVEELCGGMLAHIPKDKESFSPAEIRDLFEIIVQSEFTKNPAAGQWDWVLREANTISILTSTREGVVPEGRKAASYEEVCDLVVHELGIHFLRSVMGDETDLVPMQLGFAKVLDAEEGWASIMGKSQRKNSPTDAGVEHYLAAGLATFEGQQFEELFATMEAIARLELAKPGEPLSAEMIKKAANLGYTRAKRCLSGTDYLPRYKPLSYFHGTESMWRFIEKIKGDDLMFTLAMLGKFDPTRPDQLRAALETRTVVPGIMEQN